MRKKAESGVFMVIMSCAMLVVALPFLAGCSGAADDIKSKASREGAAAVNFVETGKDGGIVKDKAERIIRQACGGGRWFPGDGKKLESAVSGFIKKAEVPQIKGRIVGAIAPHAGYDFSGKVAGYTFKAIQAGASGSNAPETVVILGFSHRSGFSGVALMDGDALMTPLGEAPIDILSTKQLAGFSKRIVIDYSLFGQEHSAENEVPFVQSTLPWVKIVVGLIGDHDVKTLNELIAALNDLSRKKKILVVASTDMLHSPDYDLVTRTDKATLEKVSGMDSSGLIKSWSPENQVFCGIMPVLAVMKFAEAQGCRKGTVLYYRNNGDDFPESRGDWVVGYGAVVFALPE